MVRSGLQRPVREKSGRPKELVMYCTDVWILSLGCFCLKYDIESISKLKRFAEQSILLLMK